MIAPVPPSVVHAERGGLDFLGPEYLTWLWWRASVEPRFVHPDGTEVFLHLDEHLEFRGERAAARRAVLRSGMPGASMEARAALRSGKNVVALRLLVARGEEEFRLTLRGDDLDVSAVRLPAAEGRDGRERAEASLDALDRLLLDLDLCFDAFARIRCGEAWPAEAAKIRAWAERPSEEEAVHAAAGMHASEVRRF